MSRNPRRPADTAGDPSDPKDPAVSTATETPGNGKTGDVQADVRLRGSVKDVAERLSGGRQAEPREPEADREQSEEIARITKLLADPKNMLTVQRIYPTRWAGQKVDHKVPGRWQCPQILDRLCEEVFDRFGAKTFKVTIHPNVPNGELKMIDAFTIENDQEDEPLWEGQRIGAPTAAGTPTYDPRTGLVTGTTDPTMKLDDSPLAIAKAAIKRKVEMAKDKAELLEAQQALAQLEEMDAATKKKAEQPASEEVLELRRQLAERDRTEREKSKEDRWESRMEKLENLVLKLVDKPATPPAQDNSLLTALITSADNKFNALMTALVPALTGGNRKGTDEDAMLDKLSKYKSLFGENSSKSAKLEDMMFELMMDRISSGDSRRGGGEMSDEDTIRFAIKEMVPLAKTWIEKKFETDGTTKGMTPQEAAKAVQEEAIKMTKATIENWTKQGWLFKPGAPGAAPALPGPAKQPALPPPATKPAAPAARVATADGVVNAPTAQQQPPAPVQPQPASPSAKTQAQEESMDVPPGPTARGYDRRKAVDFIVKVAIEDIERGCPPDTFIVGDILDRLDDEILDQFLKVTNGQELEALLAPHATPELLEKMKVIGNTPEAKQWLTRVLVTAQDTFRQELEEEKSKGT